MRSFIVSKVLVVNEKGEILALRRSQTDDRRPGQWDFPGGWVDTGEDVHKAAIRETKEEAGIDIVDPELVFAFSEVDPKRGNGTWLVYIEHIAGDPVVTLSDEHDAFAWKKLEDLLAEITYERQQKMLTYVLEHGLLKRNL